MRSLLSVAALLFLGAISQAQIKKPAPSRETTAIDKMRYSVVQINAFKRDDTQRTIKRQNLGTGFLVTASGYIITNEHVIRALPEGYRLIALFREPELSTPGLKIGQDYQVVDLTTIDVDALSDLALLKTVADPAFATRQKLVSGLPAINAPISISPLAKSMPAEGSNVLISGYPLEINTLVTQTGIVASKAFRFNIGDERDRSMPELIFVNVPINHGSSGSPVYLRDTGEIIGVAEGFKPAPVEGSPLVPTPTGIQAVYNTNSGIGFVIPSKFVISLLEKNKVSQR